jgi:hypothetical protein
MTSMNTKIMGVAYDLSLFCKIDPPSLLKNKGVELTLFDGGINALRLRRSTNDPVMMIGQVSLDNTA